MEKAILRTLAYADVFDYPLKEEEIWKFLILENAKPKTKKELESQLKKNSYLLSPISCHQGFYYLKGRQEVVALRKQREQYSASKIKLAGKVAGILRLIPWVKLIGVTGALAMNNADKEDDIDLLIITKRKRLWLTRGLVVSFLRLARIYRRPGKIKDKICLNMFLDESHLALPEKERDLFSAHEVCQMRPIFVRGNTYSRFLQENSWVRGFLPNGIKDIKKLKDKDIKEKKKKNFSISQFLNFFENKARKFQLIYMEPKRTEEIVKPHRIRFHPQDAREWVLKEYQQRLKKLQID